MGLITRPISAPFFAPLWQGIEGAAREASFDVLIYCTQSAPSPGLASHRFDPVLATTGGVKGGESQAPVNAWLREDEPIDAVLSWDDDATLEVIYGLQRASKRVPEDVALVGFDDIHLAHYLAPPLKTVRVPVEQAGRDAVHQLVRLIESGTADKVTMLPTELVVHHSYGCNK